MEKGKQLPIDAMNFIPFDYKAIAELDLQFFAGAANKIKFGLKNAHYAVITDTGIAITYGDFVRMPGAVSLSLSPNGEITEFDADDITYWSAEINNGYDGDLEIADLPESFTVDVLGEEHDAVNGVLYESSNTQGKKFAIAFEINGDVKARRYVLYYCTATRPSLESQTKSGNKVEPGTAKLTFQSRPHPYSYYIKANTTSAATTVFDNWFESVHEKEVTPAP